MASFNSLFNSLNTPFGSPKPNQFSISPEQQEYINELIQKGIKDALGNLPKDNTNFTGGDNVIGQGEMGLGIGRISNPLAPNSQFDSSGDGIYTFPEVEVTGKRVTTPMEAIDNSMLEKSLKDLQKEFPSNGFDYSKEKELRADNPYYAEKIYEDEKNKFTFFDYLNQNPQYLQGLSTKNAAFMFGQSLGFEPVGENTASRRDQRSGNLTRGIGAGLKTLLSVGRDVGAGYGFQNRTNYAEEQYYNQQRDLLADTGYTYLEKGGKMKNSKVMAGDYELGSPNEQNYNAEVEGEEYIRDPESGNVRRVVGDGHENGGVKANLQEGEEVLSEKLKIGKALAKEFKESHDIKVGAKDTYAEVLRKIEKKLKYDKTVDEQAKYIDKLEKNQDIKDETTRRLNETILSEKINEYEIEKKNIDRQREEVFQQLFNAQEKKKGTGEESEVKVDETFEKGGVVGYYEDGGKEKFRKTIRDSTLNRKDALNLWSEILNNKELSQEDKVELYQEFNDKNIQFNDPFNAEALGFVIGLENSPKNFLIGDGSGLNTSKTTNIDEVQTATKENSKKSNEAQEALKKAPKATQEKVVQNAKDVASGAKTPEQAKKDLGNLASDFFIIVEELQPVLRQHQSKKGTGTYGEIDTEEEIAASEKFVSTEFANRLQKLGIKEFDANNPEHVKQVQASYNEYLNSTVQLSDLLNDMGILSDDEVSEYKERVSFEVFKPGEVARELDVKWGNFSSTRPNVRFPFASPEDLKIMAENDLDGFGEILDTPIGDLKNLGISEETIQRVRTLSSKVTEIDNPELITQLRDTKISEIVQSETLQETPLAEIEETIEEVSKQTLEDVPVEDLKKEENPEQTVAQTVNLGSPEAMKRAQYLFTPDQRIQPPSPLQPHLKVQDRRQRLDPMRLGTESQEEELYRSFNMGIDAINNLPDSQNKAVIAQMAANTQRAMNQAIGETERTNQQTRLNVEQFNIGQADMEQAQNNTNALDFERRQLTAVAGTERDYRDFFRALNQANVENYKFQNEIRNLNQLYEQVGIGADGVVNNEKAFLDLALKNGYSVTKKEALVANNKKKKGKKD